MLVVSDGVLPLPTKMLAHNADPAVRSAWLNAMFLAAGRFRLGVERGRGALRRADHTRRRGLSKAHKTCLTMLELRFGWRKAVIAGSISPGDDGSVCSVLFSDKGQEVAADLVLMRRGDFCAGRPDSRRPSRPRSAAPT